MNPNDLQKWQDAVDDEIARLSTSDEYDDDDTRERLAALQRLSDQLDTARRLTEGNPGEGTLHDMLADAADHVDYEAAVVEAAADEIEDDEIAAAADEQAEAMVEAADALDDAADAARDTAAEVFTETGIPQDVPKPDDDLDDVVRGNPLGDARHWDDEYSVNYSHGLEYALGLNQPLWVAGEFASWFASGVEDGRSGDPSEHWDTWAAANGITEGNPGEAPVLIPAPSEPPPDTAHLVPAEAPPAAPTQAASDSAPESAHWYTNPIGRRG